MGFRTAINLNLCSDSSYYEEIRYPAGETQVRIRPLAIPALQAADQIRVIARVGTAQDVISLLLLSSALETVSHQKQLIHLIMPYLPYSRADRRFTSGDCKGLKTFGDMLRETVFNSIETLDVHNMEAAERYIPNLYNHNALALVHRAIADFAAKHLSSRLTILFPDEGARERYVVPGHLSCNTASIRLDVLHCTKKRDAATGKFLGFDVPDIDASQPALIIDDICDGGGTFLGIAEELEGKLGHLGWTKMNLGLYVTHGIFSKGFAGLDYHFDQIYTTDTLDQLLSPVGLVKVYDAMPILLDHQQAQA